MRWAFLATSIAAILVILFVGLKIGGEIQERNCLQRVDLGYPTSFTPENSNPFSAVESGSGGFHIFRQRDREAALAGCHSWP